jgi:hypothetical protein
VQKFFLVSCHDPSLKNNKRALGVQLQDEAQISSQVCGAVVTEGHVSKGWLQNYV